MKTKTDFRTIAIKQTSYDIIAEFSDFYDMKIYGALDMLIKLGIKEFNKINNDNELFKKEDK